MLSLPLLGHIHSNSTTQGFSLSVVRFCIQFSSRLTNLHALCSAAWAHLLEFNYPRFGSLSQVSLMLYVSLLGITCSNSTFLSLALSVVRFCSQVSPILSCSAEDSGLPILVCTIGLISLWCWVAGKNAGVVFYMDQRVRDVHVRRQTQQHCGCWFSYPFTECLCRVNKAPRVTESYCYRLQPLDKTWKNAPRWSNLGLLDMSSNDDDMRALHLTSGEWMNTLWKIFCRIDEHSPYVFVNWIHARQISETAKKSIYLYVSPKKYAISLCVSPLGVYSNNWRRRTDYVLQFYWRFFTVYSQLHVPPYTDGEIWSALFPLQGSCFIDTSEESLLI